METNISGKVSVPAQHLLEVIARFQKKRILVVGDVMLDRFIWGRVVRISPEAPVPVVEVDREKEVHGFRLGGAANVANNIVKLGGKACLVGVAGNDDMGERLRLIARDEGIGVESILVDNLRPTSVKSRVIAHNQQIVRFDVEERSYVSESMTEKMLRIAKEEMKRADALLFSDYAKGVITEHLVEGLKEAAISAGKPVVVDPTVKNFSFFHGVDLISPNRNEACGMAQVDPETRSAYSVAARRILEMLKCKTVLVTLGEEGMYFITQSGESGHIPTIARGVYDVTGAGDTVAATITLALSAGASLNAACVLSNMAAGVVVGKVGTASVTRMELSSVVLRFGDTNG